MEMRMECYACGELVTKPNQLCSFFSRHYCEPVPEGSVPDEREPTDEEVDAIFNDDPPVGMPTFLRPVE